MTVKEQLYRIKENWLIALIVVVVALFVFAGNGAILGAPARMLSERASFDMAAQKGFYPPQTVGDFAPGVSERKITKSANLGLEADNGKFETAESRLKKIVEESGSYLLNENVNTIGKDDDAYHQGSYQIKVESSQYGSIIAQLKGLVDEIGEVTSFSENAEDITAQYVNNEIELKTEKSRLEMFKGMMAESTNVADKINLADRIFDQERRVQYLEEALKNKDLQVEYSSVFVSLSEKAPAYLNVNFVDFSTLVRSLVNSVNSLLTLLFVVLPYALALFVLWVLYRLYKNYTE